ncbi:MAG TPA: FIST N-terminal domain-containing protein [Gaiellales bacterium]|jgi:small ligand-binding sensory domain FIST|nr:FIST N-terminal domain-containing protein [Gaiellales bacterium]
MSAVRCAAEVVTGEAGGDASACAAEAARAVRDRLGGAPADVAFVFVSPHHAADAEAVSAAIRETLEPGALAGASTEAVIGAGRELEASPAVSVLAASLGAGAAGARHLSAGDPGDLGAGDTVVLVADPYTYPVDGLLDVLNAGPGTVAVGGMASGGGAPGEHALFCDDEVHREGAVAVEVTGPVRVRVLVSQGCAAIGPEMVITRAERNVVLELAGRPAYERLAEVVHGLDPATAALAARGVLAGLVIDENRAEYGPDDFLMRGILGGDQESGALAVADLVRVGQTMRFHVRDAATADAGLTTALRDGVAQGGRVQGGLLFACNGRGTNMFPGPDHDAAAAARELGGAPVAGMFCAGEIGPVGGRTFLHGFTATMALLVSDEG